jgi:YVTN family beta-propeller protein
MNWRLCLLEPASSSKENEMTMPEFLSSWLLVIKRIKMLLIPTGPIRARCGWQATSALLLIFPLTALLADLMRLEVNPAEPQPLGSETVKAQAPIPAFTESPYKGPCQIISSPHGQFLYVTEKDAYALAIIDLKEKNSLKRIALPSAPTGLCLSPDKLSLYVTCAAPQGSVCLVDMRQGIITDTIRVGYGARGPCVAPDGRRLYVCNQFSHDLSLVDLIQKQECARIPCSREPYAAAITADGQSVFVSNRLPAGLSNTATTAAVVTVIDTKSHATKSITLLNGTTCMGNICSGPNGKYIFTVAKLARYMMPTTQLERGWMNTNALIVIDVKNKRYINTVLLDDIDLGGADPYAVAVSADGAKLYVSHAGSQQLSMINLPGLIERLLSLPLDKETRDRLIAEGKLTNANSELNSLIAQDVPNDLGFLKDIRCRINLPGDGPRGIAVVGEDVYCALYFSDTIACFKGLAKLDTAQQAGRKDQVADWRDTSIIRLGPAPILTAERQGEIYFNDASVCFQNWLSCATCHPDGRIDALNWDLLDDGLGNPKNCKSLLLAHATTPSLSLGIHGNFSKAVRKRINHQLFSAQLLREPEDLAALEAYLRSLKPIPSPYLLNGQLSERAKTGQNLFAAEHVGCSVCHPAPLYTDRQKHNVNSKGKYDRQDEFDTPSLVECWRTYPYLHDGSYLTVKELLTKGGHGDLKNKLRETEIDALVEFVLSL